MPYAYAERCHPDLQMAARLLQLVVPSDSVVWFRLDPTTARLRLLVWSELSGVPQWRSASTTVASGHPLLAEALSGADVRWPRRLSDAAGGAGPPGEPENPLAAPYQLCLRTRGHDPDMWVLVRHDVDFAPHEVRMAGVLLHGIPSFAPAPVPESLVRLTPREAEILGLLGEGMTAEAIARRTGISVRTVHKHLEHVYVKLARGDRLSAVNRARELGLLPPGRPSR
ncbi:response regulator transcription factor [Nonomuraea maritima]|uniref:response regulator transcription factor n=1 Tax=Nonomuraea maritima TaxID=683260 RepID=UPI00371EA0DD